MQGPIVVPLDGSQLSEHALTLGIVFARRDRVPLHLVRVHQPLPEGEYALLDKLSAELRAADQEYLDKVAGRVRSVFEGEVEVSLLEGPVASSIEAYARAHRAALIVATTHGRGGLSRMWLGSTVDALVRLEGIPVLAMRPDEGPPNLTRIQGLRHILVPLDGSEDSEAVLPRATALGGSRDVRYTLVQVVRATPPLIAVPGPWPPRSVTPAPAMIEQLVTRAETYLREVAARLHAGGIEDVRSMVVVDDHPANALLRCVSTYKTDLIAMATHGRGASRLVVGSVADKVLRGAGRPVLLVRPQRVALPEGDARTPGAHKTTSGPARAKR